jgi:hypothetical protein
MILNGSPLGLHVLDGFGAAAVVAQPIEPGRAYRWTLAVLVAGVDMSARLTGTVSTDRERGAAGVASFTLQLAPGPVLPMDWVGRPVTIDYITTALGQTTQTRRYSGRVITTEWDPLLRLLACHCGDQLQQRVEALTLLEVETLTPSYWSANVFEAPAGRSRWDYLQERIGTIQASLDSSPAGVMRLTSWYATWADFSFEAGSTIYNTVKVAYADLTSLTNTVEVEASYRFSRLHQSSQRYVWNIPGSLGGAAGGFCLWRQESTELPDVPMIDSAVEGAGYSLFNVGYNRLPPSHPDPCGNGNPWTNRFADLLLGATFLAAKRWTQAITEKYVLSVVAPASVAQAGPVISRTTLAVEYASEFGKTWESAPFGLGVPKWVMDSELQTDNGHADDRDNVQRSDAIRCTLNQAKTAIILAHTGTSVSWDVPTSMVLAVDLVHTLRIADQGITAQARCNRVLDTFDLTGGTAITTLSIGVMRGGGSDSDALVAPAFSAVEQPDNPASIGLTSQLGRRNDSPPLDEALDGFVGNWDNGNPSLEAFPRRFQITAPEIPASDRDESTLDIPAVYRLAIPNDLLEF